MESSSLLSYKLLTKSDVILFEDLRKDKNLEKGVNSFMILFKILFFES